MLSELKRQIAELKLRLDNTVRAGFVDSVDSATGTARVQFPDTKTVSAPLPVLQQCAQGDDYSMPAIGQQVLVVFIPVGLDHGQGCVIGRMYSKKQPSPQTSEAVRTIEGDDLRLGSGEATDYVALSNLVKTALDQLKTAISTAVPVVGPGGDGGTALLASMVANLASWPPEVAAQKVKAQ